MNSTQPYVYVFQLTYALHLSFMEDIRMEIPQVL